MGSMENPPSSSSSQPSELYCEPGQYNVPFSIREMFPDIEPAPRDPENPSFYGLMNWDDQAPEDVKKVLGGLSRKEITIHQAVNYLLPGIPEPEGGYTDAMCLRIIFDMIEGPQRREKLTEYNTFSDAVELFRTRKNILFLTGAGVSVACGIPDFRSKKGIYARLKQDFPDLPHPQCMFDIHWFDYKPDTFYAFAKDIFPGQFEPSLAHKFIRQLEINGQLLRNYTQNIDTLEDQCGIKNVLHCHGSFAEATCRKCKKAYPGSHIKDNVMTKTIPHCDVTGCDGIIKPNIVFFGEDLALDFQKAMVDDRDIVDLVVVMGSSLKVGPVNMVPFCVNQKVPQILINKEVLEIGWTRDIDLLGNCDDIIREICFALGGEFKDLVFAHDKSMKERNPDYRARQLPRTMLDHESFIQRMHEGEYDFDNEQEEGNGKKNEGDEEPKAKRVKKGTPPSLEEQKRRYVKVTNKFPKNGYFYQTDFHTTLFFGSYAYYDLKKKELTNVKRDYLKSIDEYSSGRASSDDDDEFLTRGGSEPPDILHDRHLTASPPPRPASCEPNVDTDTLISNELFQELITKQEEQEDEEDDYLSSGGESPNEWASDNDNDESLIKEESIENSN